MNEELPERLRAESRRQFPERMRDSYAYHASASIMDEAAAVIEALQAKVEAAETESAELVDAGRELLLVMGAAKKMRRCDFYHERTRLRAALNKDITP